MSSHKRLLVGCPVLRREWVIGQYLNYALAAIGKAQASQEIDFAFLFVGSQEDPTFEVIHEVLAHQKIDSYVSYTDEEKKEDTRDWQLSRYQHMTDVRNHLLENVRAMGPDYFLSVDSDILVHVDGIANLLETIRFFRFDAVGGRVYLSKSGNTHPSNATLTNTRGFTRDDTNGIMGTDVIMAMKLMSPAAYAVDYQVDRRGEDFGICEAWKEAGLKIGYDGRVANKHIFTRDMLNKTDERVGF